MSSRVILLLIVTFVKLMECLTSEGTTTRSTVLQDSRKIDTHIPKPANNALLDILDVRTPPKIKLQQDKKKYEQSHPGVAIPIDEDSIDLDDSATKKYSFYKLEKPTTDSSISTWILLSGQAAVTTKVSTIKPTSPADIIVPIYSRTKKPIEVEAPSVNNEKIRFTEINKIALKNKKKPTSTTTTTTSTTEATTTKKPIEQTTTIKNKIKVNYTASTTETIFSRHSNINKTTIKHKKKPAETTTYSTESTKSSSTISPTNKTNLTLEGVNNTLATNSSTLSLESKDGSIVLTNEKKKKTSHKKKKNKRRKKPANKSTTGIESATKIKKQKNAIGSQIYSYLSREIVPTLGVGLVGLMVTAGLAGYFLFPFGAARRNINIDRNDKDNYFYKDEYSGGMLEEDAIGQLIAGMPSSSLYPSKSSATKNPYLSKIYRSNHQSPIQYNQQYSKSSENVAALFEREDDKKVDVNEDKNNNAVNSTRFVVGSVHNEAMEEVTPVTVPEHGPRSLKSQSTNMNFKRILGIIN